MTEARSVRAAVAAALLFSGIAAAAVRPVSLTYEVQPGIAQCPDERWVKQAVAARLGVDPFSSDAEVRVAAQIRRVEPGLAATVQVTNLRGEKLGKRELTSATGDCLELASAMELAIAIAVDPQHLVAPGAHGEPPREKIAEPVQPPPTPVAVVPAPAAPADPPSQTELLVGMAGFVGMGLSPSVGPGLALAVRLQWLRFSIGVEGRTDLAASVALGAGTVGSRVFLGALVPCARFGRFDACGVLTAGALQVAADLTSPPRQETSPLLLAGLRVGFGLSISSRVSIRPFAEVEAVITRTTILAGTTRVWATGPIAGTLGASFWVQLF